MDQASGEDTGHFKMDFNFQPEKKRENKSNIPSFTDKPFGHVGKASKKPKHSVNED